MNTLRRHLAVLRRDPAYAARMALGKARALAPLDYFFLRNGYAFPPVHLTLEVTHRCNLRCHMCDLFGREDEIDSIRSRREDPARPFGVALLDKLCGSFGIVKPVLSFGGGEPLMHPRIDEMVARAKRRGFVCTLTTNATLLEQHAAALVDAGLDSIVVSIDGPEEVHDAVRGVKGTFARARAGAIAVAERRAARGKSRPRVRINCTVNSRNFARLSELPGVAEEFGAESLVFSHLWFWDRDIVERHNRLFGDLCPVVEQNTRELDLIRPEVLSRELAFARARGGRLMVKFLPDLDDDAIRRYYTERARPVGRSACRAVWLSAFVMPHGELIPCLDYSYGNLHEKPFAALWNGARARAFRKRLRSSGIFPGCVRCCMLYAF